MANRRLPFRSPPESLFRIARKPDPWAAPDWANVGDDGTFGNRFDDSEGYFRVLYASSSPLGCFLETLARYRKPPNFKELLAALEQIKNAPNEPTRFAKVPISWLDRRLLGQAVSERTRFADVYSAEWLSYLRRTLEPGFMALRIDSTQDFDLSQIASQNRTLTQQIATVVYRLGYDGVYYSSRHGRNLHNWALFEPFELEYATATPLTRDHPDLLAALTLLNLSLDPSL